MKKTVFAIALAFASLSAAQAQTAAPKQLYFVGGMGLTFGGDKLATVSYEKIGDVSIKAGAGVIFVGGVENRVNPSFSLQSTIGFHVDDTPAAKNGSVKFQRFPVELMGYYHFAPQFRLGGGARYVSNPKLKGSGVAGDIYYKFDNTLSPVLEGEYMYSDNLGFKLRYVSEKYEAKGVKGSIDANHVGISANFYF
jgi:opacity protein-like surface antigen